VREAEVSCCWTGQRLTTTTPPSIDLLEVDVDGFLDGLVMRTYSPSKDCSTATIDCDSFHVDPLEVDEDGLLDGLVM